MFKQIVGFVQSNKVPFGYKVEKSSLAEKYKIKSKKYLLLPALFRIF